MTKKNENYVYNLIYNFIMREFSNIESFKSILQLCYTVLQYGAYICEIFFFMFTFLLISGQNCC